MILLRMLHLFEKKLPAALQRFLTVQHNSHLPGSFAFAGDVLSVIAGTLRQVSETIGNSSSILFAVLGVIAVIGVKLNVTLVVVIVLFLISVVLATYVALPQPFEPILRNFPTLKESLARV
jgi:uncharacterized membrane protein